jgi:hypothetical protein
MATDSAYDLTPMTDDDDQNEGRELSTTGGALSQITGSEIAQQIEIAKKYPRSIRTFQREALEMVTLSEDVASECMYALPRGGKKIEGPSARFAEIIASAYGNCRAGARTMGEDGKFVTAMGFFFDTQRNVAITYEVQRRVTDKHGRTFNDDMIGVTANAACSIALRNAILKGVPKAFWKGLYDAAKRCAIGDAETLGERRTKMLQYFAKMGAQPDKVFALLEIAGEQDITLDHLATLKGLATSIKDGDTTVDQAFNLEPPPKTGATKGEPVQKAKRESKQPPPLADRFTHCIDAKHCDQVYLDLLKDDPTLDAEASAARDWKKGELAK